MSPPCFDIKVAAVFASFLSGEVLGARVTGGKVLSHCLDIYLSSGGCLRFIYSPVRFVSVYLRGESSPHPFREGWIKCIEGGVVESVSCLPGDRVLRLDTAVRKGLSVRKITVYIELLGSQANLVLVENGRILSSLRQRSAGLVRPVFPGFPYHEPEPIVPFNLLSASPRMLEKRKELFHPLELEFILSESRKLSSSFGECASLLLEKACHLELTPSVVDGSYVSVFPLDLFAPARASGFVDINEAIRFAFEPGFLEYLKRHKRTFSPKRAYIERALRSLRSQIEHLSKWRLLQEKAELLSVHRMDIPRDARKVVFPSLYSDDKTVEIELDPSVPLQRNIERYFSLARRFRRGLGKVKSRIEELERRIEFSLNEVAEGESASGSLMPHSQPSRKPFYRFVVDGFELFVGRSAKENYYVTFSIGGKEDMFFHAHNIPGSHLILKTNGKDVPRRTIERVASIAAYFSKGRTFSTVEVAYTKRKWVHRTKSAVGGKVVLVRYKTILVEPRKPDFHS
ncbi:DUF814 domain-containing protein [bacterium]|nr:DUF814 domain-containing protein [bacterium]